MIDFFQVNQSFKEYLLNVNNVPDTVQSAGTTMVNSVDVGPASWNVQSSKKDRLHKNKVKIILNYDKYHDRSTQST